MCVSDRRHTHTLTLLATAFLVLLPQFAMAAIPAPGPLTANCSSPWYEPLWFDTNPVQAGQQTYIHRPAGWTLGFQEFRNGTLSFDGFDNSSWNYVAQPNSGVPGYVLPSYIAVPIGSVAQPGDSYTYTFTYGPINEYDIPGYETCSATLYVNPPAAAPAAAAPPPPPPTVLSCTVTFDKNPIKAGESAVISWSSTKANLFYINGIGYVGGSGSARISPGSTSDFGGYVSDASGATVSCPATLTVSNSCPPGQVLINGKCTQSCPPGFTYRDGQCVFVGCPLGYVRQGDQCVFSACPAGYYKDGDQCVRANQCTTPPKCVGNDLVNSCNDDTIAACDWGCTASKCNPVPAPSGVINASPKLLRIGKTSSISWSATNVRACTVTGTNGDAWTGNSSSGKTSKPIQMQTTYYLHCDGYAGSSPAAVDKQVTINIIPSFNEK